MPSTTSAPRRDFRSLDFVGSHQAVLQAVRDGRADAGCVRSDELEQTRTGEFRVLDPIPTTPEYPLPSTTPVYPEWVIASLHGTPETLAQGLVLALLKLDANAPAARAAGLAGWTIPLNYHTVHETLRSLHLPPYENAGRIFAVDVVRQFWPVLSILTTIFLALALVMAHVIRLYVSNYRLTRSLETQLAERERAQRALRESEAFYHSLVETLPQNIFRKNAESRFTFVNRRFAATVGRPAESLIGLTDFDLFPAEMAAKYQADDQQVMESLTAAETVEQHVTPDGRIHYVQVIKSPLVDYEGYIAGTQSIFWDVTDQRRAAEELARSEERFALAVRGSNDGLWDWDLEKEAIYFSPRFKELLGYPDHEMPNTVHAHLSRIHPEGPRPRRQGDARPPQA